MTSLYHAGDDYMEGMTVSVKAVEQAISRTSDKQKPNVDDLLLLIMALRSNQSLRYTGKCLHIFLRHLRVPGSRSGTKEHTAAKALPLHIVALAGLSVIMIHAQFVANAYEKIWFKLKKRLEVFLECIDDGLAWCSSVQLESSDILKSTTYPEVQPARFPYTVSFMLARICAFDKAGRRIRYKDGSGSDVAYLMYLSTGDLYNAWKLDGTEKGILLEDLIAETLASRVNTLRLWSRNEKKHALPVLRYHFQLICDFIIEFRREAYVSAGRDPNPVDDPKASTLDVPLLRRHILSELTRLMNVIGEHYRKDPLPSDNVSQHDLLPVVSGAIDVQLLFLSLNHCTPRGVHAYTQVLETVRAGFIPLVIRSLDKLCDYPTFDLHTLFPKAQAIDYWQATWMSLHYVLAYSVYPSILHYVTVVHPFNLPLTNSVVAFSDWQTINETPTEALTDPEATKKCSGCSSILYCSTACQRADWKAGHRDQCQVQATSREEPEAYIMRGISGNPALEAQLDGMFRRAEAEVELEAESEKGGRPLWPRIRLIEGNFVFGQNAICVTMQFQITSASEDEEDVDIEMIQAVTRIGNLAEWLGKPTGQK
ncbi:hypothetical protein BKA70DRAFT_1556750 [Coprinopsis sp. MPI-PUGE-AT-0042]|nr:hypothetical protein BKA70DRAFT_1556750 [Coprinopsis sp. MPI-PUGE-AT-0042]